LTESVKVAKRCRQRKRRIFADQGGGKTGDTTDEVGGQSVKESGEGGGTECAVPVGNKACMRKFLQGEEDRWRVVRLRQGGNLQVPQVI
jgi:hypothetical protein